jgi:hypothetical protein
MHDPKEILQRLVDLYKMTPSQVKKTLAADANNAYGLAWHDALDYIKKTPDSEIASGTE